MLVSLRGRRVKLAEYAVGGEKRREAGKLVLSLSALGKGFECRGQRDGLIRVWNRATLDQTLAGHTGAVMVLVLVEPEGWLIRGLSDQIRVCDVATGRFEQCEGTLVGHTKRVHFLAVSGTRLVRGSWDKTATVLKMEGAALMWRCKRMLVDGEKVACVTTWGSKMASGSGDMTMWVWDVGAVTHK